MKTTIILFFVCHLALGELPPPLPLRNDATLFKPSPQLVPSLDVKIPPRLTIEQLIRLTEQLQSSRISNGPQPVRAPQQSYGRPLADKLQQFPSGSLNQAQSSSCGGPWQSSSPQQFQQPQQQTQRPQQQFFQQQQQQQQQYRPGISDKLQGFQSQQQFRPVNQQQQQQQQQLRPPATSYGVPDFRSLETLDKQQQLPNYRAPSAFKPQQQYPPSGGDAIQSSFGESVTNAPQAYLPPKTTRAPVRTTTTGKPIVSTTTVASLDYDYDSQQSTEPPNQEGADSGPNISVANAVAGAGSNFFYVQQPDGRLQKVVLQKVKEPNSKPEEYVANYYFQNVQSVPDTVYTPLISLGSLALK